MSEHRVFLGGEGRNELGGWAAAHPSYRTEQRGVIEALLRKAKPSGWVVCGARVWKNVRAFRVGGYAHRDSQIVLGLALDAREAGADVLAFSRDRDNDPERETAIEKALDSIRNGGRGPMTIGGVAKPCIEGWVLAAKGVRGTDGYSRSRCSRELGNLDTAAMVGIVESSPLPAKTGAQSLDAWMDSAAVVLSRP